MKKILLFMVLILSIRTLKPSSAKPSLADFKKTLDLSIRNLDTKLTVDKFLILGFRPFDNDVFLEEQKINMTNIRNNRPLKHYTYLENVKEWWNNENNWFTDLFPVEDSISRKAAIGLTKAVRAVWFTPKAIISFADNLRMIFFNHSKTFNDFLIRKERGSLISFFSKIAKVRSQAQHTLKIVNALEDKTEGTASIEDIRKAFGAWTERGALSDLKDALFPKKILNFGGGEIEDQDFWSKLGNVTKKVVGTLDIFNWFYKGNDQSRESIEFVRSCKDHLKDIYDKFNPELKLAFFKQLSIENQKILYAKVIELFGGETMVKENDFKAYLGNLEKGVQAEATDIRKPLLPKGNLPYTEVPKLSVISLPVGNQSTEDNQPSNLLVDE